MNTALLLCKGAILAVTIAIFAGSAPGQSDTALQDLRRSFRRFDLTKVKELPPQAGDRSRNLVVRAVGRELQLKVVSRDLRSPRYRSEDSANPGARMPAQGEVNTFNGFVEGESTSAVRITIDGSRIEGYFTSRGEKFFIEPARKYTNLADANDSVVYRKEDSLVENTVLCEADLPTRIDHGKELLVPQRAQLVSTAQELELATDADLDYVNRFGGAAQANNEILSILNMAEGVYQNELNMSISVVYQHTWTTPDPYDGTSMNTVLTSFLNHWNANVPTSSVPRDAAHLFTAKASALSAGLAYVGVICRSPAYAYGLSGFVNWAPGKYLIPTHEIGHNLAANHVDASQSCGNTVMNAQLTNNTPLTFCPYSRTEINNYVGANGSCLTPTQAPAASTPFDFDGDRRADISVFRALAGDWYINRSTGGLSAFHFGLNGDLAVPADYDGDGRADAAVYRGGTWYRLRSTTNTADVVSYGLPTDIPVPADFDGDQKADAAVYRPTNGTWYVLTSGQGSSWETRFGLSTDIPVAADYDGDNKADINVFRPATGTWYRMNSATNSLSVVQFGLVGDKPVSGDFDGDAKSDIAVWRPSTGVWYVLRSSNGSFSAAAFGLFGDLPTAADYDGDGRTDVAVFRPVTGVWHRLNSSNGAYSALQFGISTDVPAPAAYVR